MSHLLQNISLYFHGCLLLPDSPRDTLATHSGLLTVLQCGHMKAAFASRRLPNQNWHNVALMLLDTNASVFIVSIRH
jgi:hypothetical protein